MPKPLIDYVRPVLAERQRDWKILQALRFGSAAVVADADSGWWRRKSTRRHVFWENSVKKLIELTVDDRDCVVVPHYDTVSFIFEGAVLVRLKKANMALRTSNYPTPQADLFDEHRTDLFGFAGLQRVEAVYIPNRFDTDIVWAGIVARENKSHLWHFELTEPAVVPVMPLPAPVHPPASSLARLRNQAKDEKNEKKKDGEDE